MFLTSPFFEQVEGVMYIISGIFAFILLSLSLYAYRQSHAKRILYASFAFIVIFIYISFEAVEIFFPIVDASIPDITFASLLTIVLFFFFLSAVKN